MKKITNKNLFLAALTLCSGMLFATNPGGGPPPPIPPPPPGFPVDGNLMALLTVSLIFGIYKLYNYNLKKSF